MIWTCDELCWLPFFLFFLFPGRDSPLANPHTVRWYCCSLKEDANRCNKLSENKECKGNVHSCVKTVINEWLGCPSWQWRCLLFIMCRPRGSQPAEIKSQRKINDDWWETRRGRPQRDQSSKTPENFSLDDRPFHFWCRGLILIFLFYFFLVFLLLKWADETWIRLVSF